MLLYGSPVPTDGLTAAFNLSMNGGNGADGAAFDLLAPNQPTSSVGQDGDGIGFAGLSGVSVQFATFPSDEVMIKSGATVVASNTSVPQMRGVVRAISISITGHAMTVRIDGATVLHATVADLTSTAMVGYSGGTGQLYDVHAISDSRIVTSGSVLPRRSTPPPVVRVPRWF